MSESEKISSILVIGDILRGVYKREDYGKIILPMTFLRRIDCIVKESRKSMSEPRGNMVFNSNQLLRDREKGNSPQYFNNSQMDFETLINDPKNIHQNFIMYMSAFSTNVKEILGHFKFYEHVKKLDQNGVLTLLITKFNEIDLSPKKILKEEMGDLFDELTRKFCEEGHLRDHYTSRDIVKLMISLLFMFDKEKLTQDRGHKSIYDCCAGTGGMGIYAQKYLSKISPGILTEFYAQEIEEEVYAICKASILLKEAEFGSILHGDALGKDIFGNKKFDYMIVNPPYGKSWSEQASKIYKEYEKEGGSHRFKIEPPEADDSQFLLIQNLIAKMNPEGSRIIMIMDDAPLYLGRVGSGESLLRKYLLEEDLIEGIIALPENIHINTGSQTYLWILSNCKPDYRKNKIQLVDARDLCEKMITSIGSKNNQIIDKQMIDIIKVYGAFKESERCKILEKSDFGYKSIIIDKPVRISLMVTDQTINNIYSRPEFEKLIVSKVGKGATDVELMLAKKLQKGIIDALKKIRSEYVYKGREELVKKLKTLFEEERLIVPKALIEDIAQGLGEKHPEGSIFYDTYGHPVADLDLRRKENIGYNQNIKEYFEKEILPKEPDAWVDEYQYSLWYEITFNKYSYKYSTVRSSEEIIKDIALLENDICKKLKLILYANT